LSFALQGRTFGARQAPVVVVYTDDSNLTSVQHADASVAAVLCTVALVEDMIGQLAADDGTTAQQHVELRAQRDAMFARLPQLLAKWVPLGNGSDDDGADVVPETEPPESRVPAAGPSTFEAVPPPTMLALALQRGAQWEQSPHRSGGEVLYMPNTSPRLFVAERDRPVAATRPLAHVDKDGDRGDGDDESDTHRESVCLYIFFFHFFSFCLLLGRYIRAPNYLFLYIILLYFIFI